MFFISGMHGLRWQREVIKPRGHLVSLTTAEVGNWVTESFRICFFRSIEFFFSLMTDALEVKIMLVEKA